MAVIVSFRTGQTLTEAPAPARAQPASPEAEAAMRAFAAAAGAELRQGLSAGQPYPVAEGVRVVWVHADGSRRLSDNPASPKA